MADNSWIFDMENRVYTIVKAKTYDKLKTKYPKIRFTTSDKNAMTEFPTVHIHKLPGKAIGTTFESGAEGDKVRFQVDIYDDKSQSNATYVAKAVGNAFIEIGFSIASPSFQNESTTYRSTMTFDRVLGSGDIL